MENIFTSLMYNVCCVCVLEVTLILLGPFLRIYMHTHTQLLCAYEKFIFMEIY